MKIKTSILILLSLGLYFTLSKAQKTEDKPKTPIMGWSSWNSFRININEQIIREQVDAAISCGMYKAGYRYINIDDGYFGGRDEKGLLYPDSAKFPSGMKALADYIHSKKLKAGIYSDAAHFRRYPANMGKYL